MTVDIRMLRARLEATENRPYFAAALWALQFVEVEDLRKKALGPIGVDKWYRCYYDPGWLDEEEPPHLMGCLVHEVNHLIRGHEERCQDRKRAGWNIATDCEINDDIGLPLPDWTVHPRLFGLSYGQTAEVYYDKLKKQVDVHPDCGSGSGGPQRPWEKGPDEDTPTEVQKELIKAQVAEDIRKAGTAPGELSRWADSFLKPKADWRVLLSRYLRGSLQTKAGCVDYTYRRLSRRRIPGVILPGLVGYETKVSIVIDSSGSMYDDIHQAVSEARAICQQVSSETIVRQVDTQVQKKAKGIRAFGTRSAILGWGGTDMRVGISEAIKEDNPDVVVVLTDGETPWPVVRPEVPVIVGCTTDIDCPPWAKVVRITPRD
jgi:predicted metal-dependent peptidase